jgi:hypothetical protein
VFCGKKTAYSAGEKHEKSRSSLWLIRRIVRRSLFFKFLLQPKKFIHQPGCPVDFDDNLRTVYVSGGAGGFCVAWRGAGF